MVTNWQRSYLNYLYCNVQFCCIFPLPGTHTRFDKICKVGSHWITTDLFVYICFKYVQLLQPSCDFWRALFLSWIQVAIDLICSLPGFVLCPAWYSHTPSFLFQVKASIWRVSSNVYNQSIQQLVLLYMVTVEEELWSSILIKIFLVVKGLDFGLFV